MIQLSATKYARTHLKNLKIYFLFYFILFFYLFIYLFTYLFIDKLS